MTDRLQAEGWSCHRRGSIRCWLAPDASASWLDWLITHSRQERAAHGGRTVQDARNLISVHARDGHELALKDFGFRHVQPVLYRFRSSKARRGALAALRLQRHGFDSPCPWAVLERTHKGLLQRAMLLTEWIPDTWTLRQAMTDAPERYQDRLPAIGRLVARLHEQQLWHADLTAGNLLVRPDTPERCWLVDVNRLRRRRLSTSARLDNIAQLGLPGALWRLFFTGYAPQASEAWLQEAVAQVSARAEFLRQRGLRKRHRRQARARRRG
ncbi:MAG: lipopolysaccharide kinase InaA family protein [Planctomycetota bacterium]